MNIDKEILQRSEQIDSIKSFLAKNPPQRIHINKQNQYYYIYTSNSYKHTAGSPKRKYIHKNTSIADTLINVKYCMEILPVLEKELGVLEYFKEHYKPENKYLVREIIPAVFRDRLNYMIKMPEETCSEWRKAAYSANPYPISTSQVFITKNGEHVRSKAELIIANMLFDMGLAYRYEAEFRVGNRVYYPDFTIMHPHSCELFYLEYFGMMDDEDYQSSALKKIAAYQKTDAAARFIYIFESRAAPMNTQSIQSLLTNIFLSELTQDLT